MITLPYIILILVAHWVGDFLLQFRDIAIGKSKEVKFLLCHILFYGTVLFLSGGLFAATTLPNPLCDGPLLAWIGINILLHFIVDYFTSRANSCVFEKGIKKDNDGYSHEFWACIGADQIIHMFCLFSTWIWLISK